MVPGIVADANPIQSIAYLFTLAFARVSLLSRTAIQAPGGWASD
jgi:hypothetical protein